MLFRNRRGIKYPVLAQELFQLGSGYLNVSLLLLCREGAAMKVLIIEDEWAARTDLEQTLRNIFDDLNIHMAVDDVIAINECRKHHFDIVFLDIHLPGKDGISLAKEILKIHPETNIIITTGDVNYSFDAYKLYVCDYILKPVNENELREAVRHLRYPSLIALQQDNNGRGASIWT